jgi:fructose-bisphosphate aldolase class II
MALVSMRQLLGPRRRNGYGLPAFNVNNLEQVQADHGRPPSRPMRRSSCRPRPAPASTPASPSCKHLIQAAIETLPDIPMVMHQDHGAVAGGVRRRHRARLLPR